MDALDWCRQRMLVGGHPLAASISFAPDEHRDAIVALRALVAEIAAVPDTVSDPDVGRRKLAWWRQALVDGAPHPAIEAMNASGALRRIPAGGFDALMAAVGDLLEGSRFERREEAWRHCLGLGGPAAELEALLVGDAALAGRAAWRSLGGFAYLVRVVRDLGMDARAHRWLVPLDLQAAYQIGRQDVASGRPGTGWEGLVRTWIEDGLARSEEALAGVPADQRWQQRHLLVAHALDRRLARQLAARPRRILVQRVKPGHFGNLLEAWRSARRIGRERGRPDFSRS